MSLTTVRVRAGPSSVAWLAGRIAELKAGSPMAPVTVAVASNHVGLGLRRSLARKGYANVRFGVMGRLVEPLGAPALAAAGRTPLTVPARDAAIREAIRRKKAFAQIGAHPALVETLAELFGELRDAELDEDALARLAEWGLMAEAALAVYGEYRQIQLTAHLYDDHDLFEAATAIVAGGQAGGRLAEIGSVAVYLPVGLKPAEVRFLRALSENCVVDVALSVLGDALADAASDDMAAALGAGSAPAAAVEAAQSEVDLLSAPDATEEVHTVVRRLLGALGGGIAELGRAAIVYRDRETYGALVRDTLDAAGIAWAGVDGRPLSESWAGRGLIGLLLLPENEFARVDVLGWLGGLPETDPGRVSIGDWDRLSRNSAVVKGSDQWRERLRMAAAETNREADRLAANGGSEGAIRYRRREAGAMDRMAKFIDGLAQAVVEPADRSWTGFAAWAEKLRRTYVPVAESWPDREREADEMVGEILVQLASAGAVEEKVDLAGFIAACASAIEGRRQAEGRLGSGIAVGQVGSLCGLEFDAVFVVGATERALPAAPPPDPVFPPHGGPDPLGRAARDRRRERRDFLAAVGAARRVTVSFPAWDADLRPSYPSPWALELARPEPGAVVTAAEARLGRGAENLRGVASPLAALEAAPALLNLGEWRVVAASRHRRSLPASSLAQRADLPLGRHLLVRAKRFSDSFTEFDGNLASEMEALPVLRGGLGERRHSPSVIETWAVCGFRYLAGRIWNIEPTDRPEQEIAWAIGAAARGQLVHTILSRFFTELHENGRPQPDDPYAEEDFRRIDAIAREEFTALEEAGGVGNALAWENEMRAILVDLQTFLRKDADEREKTGLVPAYFEQGFGGGDVSAWPEVELALPSGARARLSGRIDRVDLGPEPARPTKARLIDYKTGSSYRDKFVEDAVVAGTRAQPSIYSAAVRARYPGIAVDSGYWFVSAKGEFTFVAVPDRPERLSEVLDVVDRGLKAGAFPQVPGGETWRSGRDGWDNCMYCDFNRICAQGRDQMWERKQHSAGASIHLDLALEVAGEDE